MQNLPFLLTPCYDEKKRRHTMKEFYTVGEIAKIFNLTTPTLRYYDSIHLISPWKVGGNGYRYYSKAQFEIISMVTFMRSLGTPIKRLKQILDEDTPDGIRQELARSCKEIDGQIEALRALKQKALLFDRNILSTCYDPAITLEETPTFYTMCNTFGAEDELNIEEILQANKKAYAWATSAGIISTITAENLEKGAFHTYESYGYLSETKYPAKNRYTHVIPRRLCVTAGMQVKSVEHFEADAVYAAMMAFIRKKGMKITGPAIERNILDLYSGNRFNPTIYFKIYIPVAAS